MRGSGGAAPSPGTRTAGAATRAVPAVSRIQTRTSRQGASRGPDQLSVLEEAAHVLTTGVEGQGLLGVGLGTLVVLEDLLRPERAVEEDPEGLLGVVDAVEGGIGLDQLHARGDVVGRDALGQAVQGVLEEAGRVLRVDLLSLLDEGEVDGAGVAQGLDRLRQQRLGPVHLHREDRANGLEAALGARAVSAGLGDVVGDGLPGRDPGVPGSAASRAASRVATASRSAMPLVRRSVMCFT